MKIVQINSVARGSTGKIMLAIAEMVRQCDGEAYTFSEKRRPTNAPAGHCFFGFFIENIFHRFFSMISGIGGTGSVLGTKILIRKLKRISPDVIHLHNLHGWYINIPMLFDFIRENRIKTVWTLHDCWGFTGQCSHFTIEKCDKWKSGCYSCPRYRLYPYTLVDRTRKMWNLKKEWFTGVQDLTIVTPSEWLADLVKQSFLKEYPVKVINNGIDLSVFKPTHSSFRERNNLIDKKIILGVASGWNYRKGLDVFIKLSELLDSNIYQIVLVGTNNVVDKGLTKSILSIHRTKNPIELAELYTAADVFVNPTREENFPTVNMEAIACGTPVVTFDTGGSKEIIDETCGVSVCRDDIIGMKQAIIRVCESDFSTDDLCIKRGRQFDANEKFSEYHGIYDKSNNKDNHE